MATLNRGLSHARPYIETFWLTPMLWFAISLHLLYGGALLAWDYRQVTTIALLGGFSSVLDTLGPQATGGLLVGVATLAAAGLLLETRIGFWAATACLMVQYALLLLALVGAVDGLATGISIPVGDTGETMPLAFELRLIGVGPIALTAFWHTAAILYRLSHPRLGAELTRLRRENLDLKIENEKLRAAP